VNWKGCVEKRSWPVCLERQGELGRIGTRSRKQSEREASGVEAGLLLADGGVLQTLYCKKKPVFMDFISVV